MKPLKTTLNLKSRINIAENILEFVFTSSESFEYTPGQYINILVAEKTWRSYSILNYADNEVMLIIDISPDGIGSHFFENIKEGDEVTGFVPLGHFEMVQNDKPKIFAATGTGIAPLIPMVRKLQEEEFKGEVYVFFGVRYDKDYFLDRYLEFAEDSNFKLTACITKSKGGVKSSNKRITETLYDEKYDLRNFDGYVCGSKGVVDDVSKLLNDLGCSSVYTEKY